MNTFFIEPCATVDFLALTQQFPQEFPLLLKSSGKMGWDILCALPEAIQEYQYGEFDLMINDLSNLPRLNTSQIPVRAFPFTGGFAGFLSYEMLEAFEPSVAASLPETFPLGAIGRFRAVIFRNRCRNEQFLCAESQLLLKKLREYVDEARTMPFVQENLPSFELSEEDAQAFLDGVADIQRYIFEGDVFQVNLSRQWQAKFAQTVSPTQLFSHLRAANPAPFSALFQLSQHQAIISSSPERLVRVDHEAWVETRPIAGTHPRSNDAREDAWLKQQLHTSLKERAEHVMLIDLERNDLGRVCAAGSIHVNELMSLATYAHVHHIESNVRGRLARALGVDELFRAMFPGGTITGCPKVRCMQIIRELEHSPRAAYTGSIFYLNYDGTFDSNILIRTFVQQDMLLRFRAGAGIVADSDAQKELEETRHKAKGLLRALGI